MNTYCWCLLFRNKIRQFLMFAHSEVKQNFRYYSLGAVFIWLVASLLPSICISIASDRVRAFFFSSRSSIHFLLFFRLSNRDAARWFFYKFVYFAISHNIPFTAIHNEKCISSAHTFKGLDFVALQSFVVVCVKFKLSLNSHAFFILYLNRMSIWKWLVWNITPF